MADEWCLEKLENLRIDGKRLSTLAEIRSKLNETANIEITITNRLLSAPEIYDCLKDLKTDIGDKTEGEQINIVNDILSICMSNISITQNNFPQLLFRALKHPRSRIRSLALNTILKEVQKNSLNGDINNFISPELFGLILEALKTQEGECGLPALDILKILLQHHINDTGMKEKLLDMLNQNETVKCRIYELAIYLAKQSPGKLEAVKFLLDRSISELDNDDVLMQVNVLEMLVDLSVENHGFLFLEERQVFEVLSGRIEEIESNPINHLLKPGIMKFFGKTGSLHPKKVIGGYPFLIKCLFDCFNSGDVNIMPVALDTFANLATTRQGKLLLDAYYDTDVKQALEVNASYLKNANTNLKKRIFQSIEVTFTCSDTMAESSAILQKWFAYFTGNANMQFLLDYCRNPFPDIKVSCLSFIRVLCTFDWGIFAIKNTAGFVEYLLDRKIEFDKEAKYAKYEVIMLLAASTVFDAQTSLQLRTYVNKGPYFLEVQMEVAVEGD